MDLTGHTKSCGGCRFEDAADARKRGEMEPHDKFLRELAEHTTAEAVNG